MCWACCPPSAGKSLTFTLGVVLLLPFYLWEQLRVQPMPLTHTTLLVVGYVAIFPSI